MTVVPAAKAAQQDGESSSGRLLAIHQRPGRTRAGMLRAVAAAAALSLMSVLAFAACGDDDDDGSEPQDTSSPSATTVKATEADGTIKLDKTSSDTGNVEFAIRNAGELTHEFVVLKTDLAEDKLPLDAKGTAVDQKGEGVEEIGERESIAPGSEAELSFDNLASGKYVLICNVPGHYGLGMHATFTVS